MTDQVWRSLRPTYAAALAQAGDEHAVYDIVDRTALSQAVAGDAPPPDAVHRAMTLIWALARRD